MRQNLSDSDLAYPAHDERENYEPFRKKVSPHPPAPKATFWKNPEAARVHWEEDLPAADETEPEPARL